MPRLSIFASGTLGPACSVEKFISTDPNECFPLGSLATDQDLTAALNEVHQLHAPLPVTAATLLHQVETATRFLPFGCAPLDSLLEGGLREGQVLELYGESGAGKTQMCLMACAHTISRGEHVLYIDTSNSFTAMRLLAVLQAMPNRSVKTEAAMACVHVIPAYTAYEVLTALDSALKGASSTSSLAQNTHTGTSTGGGAAQAALPTSTPNRPSLIILDSLGAVISPLLGGGQHVQGHAVLAAAASSMKQLALALNAAVLVTNHMVGGGSSGAAGASFGSGVNNSGGGGRGWSSEKRPALGESWQNQAHVRVQLALPSQEGGPCTATMRASTLVGPGKVANYWLTGAGAEAAPPAAPVQGHR